MLPVDLLPFGLADLQTRFEPLDDWLIALVEACFMLAADHLLLKVPADFAVEVVELQAVVILKVGISACGPISLML